MNSDLKALGIILAAGFIIIAVMAFTASRKP